MARQNGTPLVIADGDRVLGVVQLKDIVKGGIKEHFAELQRMGIKTVMITGDNPLTAAAIAAEAGVDDFLAEATPEANLRLIRDHQADLGQTTPWRRRTAPVIRAESGMSTDPVQEPT